MDFKYQTKSGRLTDKRKNELRAYAKFKLGFKPNAPLRKVLTELNVSEDEFYPYMEEFIAAELKLIADKMREKELKKQKQNERRKIVRKQKKVKKVITPPPPPLYFTYNKPNDFQEWRDIMAIYSGQTITMTFIDSDNNIIETHEYDIPAGFVEFRRYCKNLWYGLYHWSHGSGNSQFDIVDNGQLVVLLATSIPKLDETINQIFRDGETNCLLTPIKNWIDGKLISTTTKKSKERYITLDNKINKYLQQYPNGVPREHLNDIANNLNVTISIELPFQKEPFILERPITKSLTTFKYMNTTYNHVDEIIKITEENVQSTQEELFNKIRECEADGTSYYFTMNNKNINKVYTAGKIYGLSTNYQLFISDFEKKYNIHSWKIDAIQQPELTKFLSNSCHYNCSMDFNLDHPKILSHIDQAKCYMNFNKCKYFTGFLSRITDFRYTNKIQGIGIYQITNIKITNEKFKRYNDFMKLYVDFNSYPSPSLEFLNSVGTYDIIGGCWGIQYERMNEDLTQYDLNMEFVSDIDSSWTDTDEQVPYYSKYFASCSSLNYEKKYYLHGTPEISNVIRLNTECDVLEYDYNLLNKTNKKVLTSVRTKKTHVFHLSHLTAFILDYAKLNIIEQLMEMPFENIVRVASDGIYFIPFNNLQVYNNYREKPSDAYNNKTGMFTTYGSCNEFCSNTIDYNIEYKFGQFREFYKTELAVGGGGSGKTHFNLVDNGSVNIIYVAPSWKLARNKQEEYKCRVATHASLLNCDPTNNNFAYSSTLLIDEVSMLTNEEKDKIMNYYKDYKIIFCGDIKYQLPFIPDKSKIQTEFNSLGFDNIMEFTSDYRATCDKLKDLKQYTRNLIDQDLILTPNDLFNKLQKVSSSEIEKIYKIEDMIICRTNIQKDSYKKLFTGKFGNLEKYYITKTINKYCCGEIIITNTELPTECVPDIRHAFTIHSIQGETCHTKLFIHKDIMTLRMFYTAISRAKRYDQIYLIE
jgi:hypothetical protein